MSPRVLIVTNDFPPKAGGIQTFVQAMADRFEPDQVVVYTSAQPDAEAFDATLPYRVIRDPSRLLVPTPAITRRAVAALQAEGCDRVWFGASAPLGLMGHRLRAAGAQRLVATSHGHEIWWAKLPITRSALRRIADRVDVLTTLGEYCRSRIAQPLSEAARTKMARLMPGVDDEFFSPDHPGPDIRARYGLQQRRVIVCVSRLVARKGQDQLIEAMPRIKAAVPDAALLIVGDGPMKRKLQRRVRALGLTGDVVITGRVPYAELPAHYAAGQVFAMPTRSRNFGLEVDALGICYLEAAAMELPVIVGDAGGAPDAVRDAREMLRREKNSGTSSGAFGDVEDATLGPNGLVVDGTDVDNIAAACVELLNDPQRCREWGRTGRAWVAQQWRWDDLAATLRSYLLL